MLLLGLLLKYLSDQQTLAMMSLPSNIESSVSNLAHLMDEIWYLAGDRSIDVRPVSVVHTN